MWYNNIGGNKMTEKENITYNEFGYQNTFTCKYCGKSYPLEDLIYYPYDDTRYCKKCKEKHKTENK